MNNKVYNDISISPYSMKVREFVFFFSSTFLLDKYKRVYSEFITNENLKLENRYKIDMDFSDMLLLLLYAKVERRGFRVFYKGEKLDQPLKAEIVTK